MPDSTAGSGDPDDGDDFERRGAAGRRGRAARRTQSLDEVSFLSLTPERARVLLLVAARPAAIALLCVVVVMLAVLLSAGGGLAGTSGAISAGWLAAHQVPLVIGKTSLGILPLLPTALLIWLAGRECARAVEPDASRADLGWIVGAAVAGPLLITAVCLAVAEDASGVIALQPPNTLAAFGWVFGVYLLAAVAGITSRTYRQFSAQLRIPEWVITGAFGAGRTVVRMLACATVVTVISFLAHWSAIGDTYRGAGNAGGVLGLSVLSLAYLPNVVLGTVGVLVGPGAEFGDASIGVFSVVGGPIPAVPVMAAVPPGPAAGWWPVLLLIPAAVGVLAGLDSARTSADRMTAPWATLTSAGLATLVLVVLGAVGGGELGSFGRIGLDLPIFAVSTFVWLAVAGYAGLVFARWFVVPAGAVETDYDDDYYVGDHDDYYDNAYADDDYDDPRAENREHDDEYDDDYQADDYFDDDYPHYDGPDLEVEVDGELVEEQPALSRSGAANTTHDIVDAEVVEADLPESDQVDGR